MPSPRAVLACLVALVACGGAQAVPLPVLEAGPYPDAAVDDAASDGASDAPVDEGAPTHLRIMAANTTSGNGQDYEAPGIRIFQGLLPDIVLIQEFAYANGDLRALVDTAFGTSFAFFVEPRVGGIPNGIVSRYPILASGAWVDASVPDRAFAWARIDVPGSIDLWAVSLHLLTTGGTVRNTEAAQLVAYLAANVPKGDYLVVGGDLNTESDAEPALSTLGGTVVVAPPFPADANGNKNTSINRNKPHDWLFARASLDARQVPVTLGAASFTGGLVFDSRVYAPLSDVAPILLGDSSVSGMQHMPVVRDFVVGGGK